MKQRPYCQRSESAVPRRRFCFYGIVQADTEEAWHKRYWLAIASKQCTSPSPASPELNSKEHVLKQGGSAVTHNLFIPNIEQVTKELVGLSQLNDIPLLLIRFQEQVSVWDL